MATKRIGLLTEGGDCPGLNAALRSVVKAAILEHGIEVVGFLDGFRGLVEDRSRHLRYDDVSNVLTQGGTILGSSNRDRLFALPGQKPGQTDRTEEALRAFRRHGLSGLICTGGNGTLTVAHYLNGLGLPIVGIPKTIDNDVAETDQAIGFDTAFTLATESIDRLHSTAASHHRILVVEVMGRNAGWIALHAGVAGGGDIILIPEIPHSMEAVCRVIEERTRKGRISSIVVLAEGAGRATELAPQIEMACGRECKAVVLGYLQRGGTPTPSDRLLASELGYAAAGFAARGQYGNMVAWRGAKVASVPLSEVAGRTRTVTSNCPLLAVARGVGTSFGDVPSK